jgi:hypothetical protein
MSKLKFSHTNATTVAQIPGGDIYVQIDTSALVTRFAASEKVMARAAKDAAKTTRNWLMTQLTKELINRSALPPGALKGRFRRKGSALTSGGYAVLWIGLNAIGAEKIGKIEQLKEGVQAGRHFFDKAFVAAIYSSKEKVWRRKGAERLPVIKMTVPINEELEEILPQYEAAAARMFSQRLEHEVRFQLGLM